MLRRPPALSASALSLTGVPLVYAVAPVPMWIIVVLLIATVVIGIVGAVFPQKSEDRLAWWQSWWDRTRHRRDDDADR
ncbi:hypothetical protein ACFFX1_11010 [Dactylosporangium sucinum]|uniref:Uncharacterized protein n=1 Tax=Dactylosporangium sucinum TaxID=1424081 RepID=A0A917WRE8_9ACTN|nr:hypothetical protein [Dactylosporangium sucinum]GGM22631.1 hypothetical protein GCM10007977_024750 [Dactylosporangium sucinum]